MLTNQIHETPPLGSERAGGQEYLSVTELAGDEVSREQIERICRRYYWAADRCGGKDVLEVACGTGQGLGLLKATARSVAAGDISEPMVRKAQAHYGQRVDIKVMDAEKLPIPSRSVDSVLLFEAIYYLRDPGTFLSECARVLRPGGEVLITTANKDLFDFNPSPFSVRYYGVPELKDLLAMHGFSSAFFGDTPLESVSLRQRLLRPIKQFAVRFRLMPRTMRGKKLLKRLVFGRLMSMPAEIGPDTAPRQLPISLPADTPDLTHKVIFCLATLKG